MKNPPPVKQREHMLADDSPLMSITGTRSHITLASDAFVAANGFAHEAIQGRPHHLARHPDTPVAAFSDRWAMLKDGAPWTALVEQGAAASQGTQQQAEMPLHAMGVFH